MQQVMAKLWADALPGKPPSGLGTSRRPTELLARVEAETEQVAAPGKSYTCRVIALEGGDVKARVWVDTADGRIIRQEASGFGDVIVLQRE